MVQQRKVENERTARNDLGKKSDSFPHHAFSCHKKTNVLPGFAVYLHRKEDGVDKLRRRKVIRIWDRGDRRACLVVMGATTNMTGPLWGMLNAPLERISLKKVFMH